MTTQSSIILLLYAISALAIACVLFGVFGVKRSAKLMSRSFESWGTFQGENVWLTRLWGLIFVAFGFYSIADGFLGFTRKNTPLTSILSGSFALVVGLLIAFFAKPLSQRNAKYTVQFGRAISQTTLPVLVYGILAGLIGAILLCVAIGSLLR